MCIVTVTERDNTFNINTLITTFYKSGKVFRQHTDILQIYHCILQSNYCRSGNIREVLIFANFARRTISRIQKSCENYYYNSATKFK